MDLWWLPLAAGLGIVPVILGIRRYHGRLMVREDPRAHLKATVPLAVVLVAFVAGAFALNGSMADRTLFEAQVDGTGDAAPAVLTFTVPVEHPGARHSFDVNPRDDGGSVDAPIDVGVRLVDPTGAVLVDEQRTLDTYDDSNSTYVSHRVWYSWDRDLTPTQAGDYVLTVTVLSPHVPQVHVWVGDEQKTDGRRIDGY